MVKEGFIRGPLFFSSVFVIDFIFFAYFAMCVIEKLIFRR